MRTSSSPWILGLAMAAAIAGAQKTGQPSAVMKEFGALQQAYYGAMQEYYKPYENAKTEEDAAKIKLDPNKNPGKAFLKKAIAFSKKAAKDQQASVTADMFVFDLAVQAGTPKEATSAFHTITKKHLNRPEVTRCFYTISSYEMKLANGQTGKAVGEKIIADLGLFTKSKNRSVQAGAIYMQSETYQSSWMGMNDPTKASALLERLLRDYKDTSYAKRAEGAMFVAKNLGIGQVAPDFEGTDENGEKFKLSDYRGKVVVLDFWGFW